MIIGVDYYPEHWDRSRWEKDAQLMQQMHINAVRIGEFGWSVIEKEEGVYDFSLYDEAIELLAKYGIKVIIGTPTATPTAWICQKYPDIYMEDYNHNVRGFGTRRHYCYNHEGYRRETKRIVRKVVEHYENNKNVIAWQIDNELGCEDEARCYCEKCRAKFILWLKEKYQTLDNLNKNWGTVFWSQEYTEWNQIILPAQSVIDAWTGYSHNPGLLLDYAHFSSDSLIGYAKLQCDEIRKISQKIISHNVVSENCDNFELGSILDRVGYDAYPKSEWDQNSPSKISFLYDLEKGMSKNRPWILEQQSGPCGWNINGVTPENEQYKLWAMRAVAKGAEALVYFRWRSCVFGTEQFWYGILDHDGVPRERYKAIKEVNADILAAKDILAKPDEKQVLLIYDYENKYCHEFQPHVKDFDYKEEIIRIYDAMMKNHLSVCVGAVDSNLADYDLVVFPYASIVNEKNFKKIEEYVSAGGNLLLTSFSGMRETNNQITQKTLPGVWKDLAGITVEEFAIRQVNDRLIWLEKLNLITAKPLIGQKYKWIDSTGVAVNQYKKGKVFYAGCMDLNYKSLIDTISSELNLFRMNLTDSVEVIIKENREYMILLNHGDSVQKIDFPEYRDIDTYLQVDELPPYGYAILKRSRK